MIRVFVSLFLTAILCTTATPQTPQPAPEMQSLTMALAGRWAITEKFERDEWTPQGGTGYGEEVWRAGPGGFTLLEEIEDAGAMGKSFGLALAWWDQNKGLQGIWCAAENPKGCDINPNNASRWDGKQFVFDTQFPRSGKMMAWHEVFTDITATSFTQTADIGEPGHPLKRWLTIHATRLTEATTDSATKALAEVQLRAVIDERQKASLEGDTQSMALSLADEYVQTDISGYVQDKGAWLKEYFEPLANLIKSGRFRWEMLNRKDEQIRVLGDCAVITGILEAKGAGAKYAPAQRTWVAEPGATFSGALRFTHVYIKRNGKWLLAALHNQLPPAVPIKQ